MNYQAWKKYESPERWTSYFIQIDEVLSFSPDSCLEIGVGNGIVSACLRQQDIQLTTLDVDDSLQPDMVGSVAAIPAKDEQFDVVLCAEVLEHLPFEQFEICLKEIVRVSKKGAVISLPHWGYTFRCIADIPGLPALRWGAKLPIATPIPTGGEHFWEIGRQGFPLSLIMSVLETYFEIEKDYLSPWMPYHHFFCLRKKMSS